MPLRPWLLDFCWKLSHSNARNRIPRGRSSRSAHAAAIERLEPRQLMSVGTIAGPETRINSYTTNDQLTPAVAMDRAGDYVAVWESTSQDGSADGIFAQRYSSSGAAQGSAFKVNTYTTGDQDSPSVAMDAAGDFVIAWDSKAQVGSGYDVFAQRYNAAGLAQGSEFRVNTYTTGDQSTPSVAIDQTGDFVITWISSGQLGVFQSIPLTGVYAQRYTAAGLAQGVEFKVNPTTTDGDPIAPRAAMDSTGNFVVTWATYTLSGGSALFARRYNSAGVALANEFKVYTSATSDQYAPAVAMDGGGDFTITWTDVPQNQNLDSQIDAQRYTPSGLVNGAAFRVNTYTKSNEAYSTIAYDAAGDFVIGWQSYGQNGGYYSAYAQRYLAAGTVQGTEFNVSPNTTVIQTLPAVAMDAAGDLMVVWQSFPEDGYGYGIYGRRFKVAAAANHPPVGMAKTVTTLEDTPYVFKTTDFGFSDPLDAPANTLTAVKITTLPLVGTLSDNGVTLTAGAHVSLADITAGKFKFSPVANKNGPAYASFTFEVQDNGGTANGGIDTDITARTMTVSVTAVNDPPVGATKTVTTLEDASYVFKTTDFVLTDAADVPANTLAGVKITTLPLAGTLSDNGVTLTAGAHVSLADITAGKFKFVPAANKNGAAYASFTFQIQDNGGTANGGIDTDKTARTMTVSVTAVNDAPVGAAKTVAGLKNVPYVFKVTDFVFSDPNDTPANTLLSVKITTLPTPGSLTDNGTAVSVGASISLADITSGKLKFTPVTNGTGASYSRFTFQIQDNGGTANGGTNTDLTPRTMTISVT